MFDGIAHNLPFLSSDIEFFREFSSIDKLCWIPRHRQSGVVDRAQPTERIIYDNHSKDVSLLFWDLFCSFPVNNNWEE
jgi:hypothetical protein